MFLKEIHLFFSQARIKDYIDESVEFKVTYDIDDNYRFYKYEGLVGDQVLRLDGCMERDTKSINFNDGGNAISCFSFSKSIKFKACQREKFNRS